MTSSNREQIRAVDVPHGYPAPLLTSQGSLWLQSVDAFVGFFRVVDDGNEGKHSNNRSA